MLAFAAVDMLNYVLKWAMVIYHFGDFRAAYLLLFWIYDVMDEIWKRLCAYLTKSG